MLAGNTNHLGIHLNFALQGHIWKIWWSTHFVGSNTEKIFLSIWQRAATSCWSNWVHAWYTVGWRVMVCAVQVCHISYIIRFGRGNFSETSKITCKSLPSSINWVNLKCIRLFQFYFQELIWSRTVMVFDSPAQKVFYADWVFSGTLLTKII